jgi:hypothetical protein
MILFLQFTITDTRYFSTFKDELLKKPQWPSPAPFREFVRSTGTIVERNKGGLASWVGENFVCRIGKAIKFPRKITLSNGVIVSNISKHLYANANYILTKYEFVFNIKTANLDSEINVNVMKVIVNELLSSSVSIKVNGEFVDSTINKLPIVLKTFHYQNTTLQQKGQPHLGIENVLSCTPQCYFYLDRSEKANSLEHNYKHIANVANIAEIFTGWHNHLNNPFRIWIHQRRTRSALITENREWRMTIMRLHSEYECLRNLFWGLSKGIIKVEERSASSDELQSYFNIAIKTFLLEENNLEYQSWTPGFFNYFSKVYALASPGELGKISTQIKDFNFRVNIKNKMINYIQKNKFITMKKIVNKDSTIFSQGDHNNVHHNQVTQVAQHADDAIDYVSLLDELKAIIEQAQKEAKTTEDYKSIVALSEAKEATEQKNAGGVISALKTAGKFAADIATKFSASVMVELLKSHTHLLS